jgi:hypothetical protein
MIARHEAPPNAMPLAAQYSDAVQALVYYEPMLDASMDPEQRAVMDADLGERAQAIFDRFGISKNEAVSYYDYNADHTSRSAKELRRATDVAAEALQVGFELDLPDDDMETTADAMVQDYLSFVEEHAAGRTPQDYSRRRRAKQILIEAAARELSRRRGIPDDLIDTHVQQLQRETGIAFGRQASGVHVVAERYYAPEPVGVQEAGTTPEIPTGGRVSTGRWSHAVVRAEPGGFVIEDANGTGKRGYIRSR